VAALTAVLLPASAAPHPSMAAAAAAAVTGRVTLTHNDKTVMSISVKPGRGIDVQWSKHHCSAGYLSPPEVFSWAGGKVPSSARPVLVPCKIKASSTHGNSKAIVKGADRSVLGGTLVCYVNSTFPYIHCFICPDEIECGPLKVSSPISDPYGGSEGHLSLFNSTITQAYVVNAKGKRTSRIKLPANVNGVHYYANATGTTINFDDLATGTTVTNQYHGQGVDFTSDIKPVIEQVDSSLAQSGDQVASISVCPGCEFFTPGVAANLVNPAQHVSVYAGYFHNADKPGDTAEITLTALDAQGNMIESNTKTVTEGQGFHTQLTVASDLANIVAFKLSAGPNDTNKPLGIDDLAFDSR
jgi:hypothetical protein